MKAMKAMQHGKHRVTEIAELLLVLAVSLIPAVSAAEDVAVVIDDAKPGTYLVTVNADQSVIVNPIRVVRPGNNPSPPPVDPAPIPTAFESEIERQARAAISAGGTLTTGAAFSEVYALVAAGIVDGSIDHTRSLGAVNLGSQHILRNSADAAKWTAFEQHARNALQVLDSQGAFKSKADYAAVLESVSSGLNRATGHKTLGKRLLAMDLSTVAKVAAAVKGNGILDGIDLLKLMELIKFIIELFKLFAPKPM